MSVADAPLPPAKELSAEPIPLSLPAILRNPKNPVAAHLHQPQRVLGKKKNVSSGGREPSKRWEGKRWTRRRDNDLLMSHPNLTLPTRSDVSLHPSTLPTATFPTPLPPHLLPRTRPAPSADPPVPDPSSALAGSFSLSLKGIRRTLRNRGPRGEELVRVVEEEIEKWEQEVRASVVLMGRLNAARSAAGRVVDEYPVPSPERVAGSGAAEIGGIDEISRRFESEDGTCPAIVEVARGEASLTWAVAEGFERFVVHCVCRHRNLVSFSKTTPLGTRLTYILLRPSSHSHRSAHHSAPANAPQQLSLGASALDTPPTTDLSSVGGGSSTDITDSETQSAKWEEDSESEMGSEIGGSVVLVDDEPSLAAGVPFGATPSPLGQQPSGEDDHADEADYSSSDDESASSIAMLSLSSSIASLDLEPAAPASSDGAPSTPARPSNHMAAAETPTPRKAPRAKAAFTLSEEVVGGDETPRRRVVVPQGEEGEGEKKEAGMEKKEGKVKSNGAGKKGSFWEFLYG